jgi:hypothetical protein
MAVNRSKFMESNMKRNKITPAAIAGALFLILAIGGSILTSHHMNRTADQHMMSAGRSGDPKPNRINDQDAAAARNPSTTGNDTNVPPARR